MTENGELILAGDIGATKTDLGLFPTADSGVGKKLPAAVATASFASCDAPGLVFEIREFLEREGAAGRVAGSCFGVAGPVAGGRVKAVNLGLELEERRLARELGLPIAILVNDLYATAYALAVCGDEEEVEILQVGESAPGVCGVLAPGTGLGMALIQASSPPRIIASEGGHSSFAPQTSEEIALWRWLRRSFTHVSRERLLSGPGLANIYRWLKGRLPEPGRGARAAAVVAAAREGEEEALHALEIFSGIMGSAAGDLALFGLTAGGIYLAGGVPPRILPFLNRRAFLAAFRDKGRLSGWLAKVPIRLVLNSHTALVGAALIARAGSTAVVSA